MTSSIFNSNPSPPADSTPPAKMLAWPRAGKLHTFNDIAHLVWTNVLWGKSVGVLCLTQETVILWAGWQQRFQVKLPSLDVLDANQSTLADWQVFFSRHSYDITLLHGAYAELLADQLAVDYVTALVKAVPSGVVVLA